MSDGIKARIAAFERGSPSVRNSHPAYEKTPGGGLGQGQVGEKVKDGGLMLEEAKKNARGVEPTPTPGRLAAKPANLSSTKTLSADTTPTEPTTPTPSSKTAASKPLTASTDKGPSPTIRSSPATRSSLDALLEKDKNRLESKGTDDRVAVPGRSGPHWKDDNTCMYNIDIQRSAARPAQEWRASGVEHLLP